MSSRSSQLYPILPFRIMLDEAMKLTRRYFMTIYPAVAIPMALAGVVMVIIQRPMINNMFLHDPSALGAEFFISYLGLIGVSMVYMLIYWIASCVIMVGAVLAVEQHPVNMAEAWRWLFVPRVFGTLLLVALIMTAGFLACCLPGYLLGILFGLVVPIMLTEEVYGTQAMGRSYNQLMYNPQGTLATLPFLRLAAIWFAGLLIAWVFGMAVGLPFGIAQQVTTWRSISSGEAIGPMTAMPSLWMQIPQAVLGTLARHAVTLYVSFCVALFYRDMSYRRQGSDLDAALDAAGASEVRTVPPPPPQQES